MYNQVAFKSGLPRYPSKLPSLKQYHIIFSYGLLLQIIIVVTNIQKQCGILIVQLAWGNLIVDICVVFQPFEQLSNSPYNVVQHVCYHNSRDIIDATCFKECNSSFLDSKQVTSIMSLELCLNFIDEYKVVLGSQYHLHQ